MVFRRIIQNIGSRRIVHFIIEYLDHCGTSHEDATLVGMHWYVDGREKTVPDVDEVNKALKKRPTIYVQRGANGVVFASSGTDRTVTADDMAQAQRQYAEALRVAVGKLPGLGDALKKLPF